MGKFRLTRPAMLRLGTNSKPQFCRAGQIVDIDGPPPISAEPLDQVAIDAFQAHHGTRRLRPNGLQSFDTTTGRTDVPVYNGGWGEFRK